VNVAVEGYASVFGAADRENDVVRAGAFRASLVRRPLVPMLLAHDPRLVAGRWTSIAETARGLRVYGVVEETAPAGPRALAALCKGVDGLSIGFAAVRARPRAEGGRELLALDLMEISIVAEPMAPLARLARVGWSGAGRAA